MRLNKLTPDARYGSQGNINLPEAKDLLQRHSLCNKRLSKTRHRCGAAAIWVVKHTADIATKI